MSFGRRPTAYPASFRGHVKVAELLQVSANRMRGLDRGHSSMGQRIVLYEFNAIGVDDGTLHNGKGTNWLESAISRRQSLRVQIEPEINIAESVGANPARGNP